MPAKTTSSARRRQRVKRIAKEKKEAAKLQADSQESNDSSQSGESGALFVWCAVFRDNTTSFEFLAFSMITTFNLSALVTPKNYA